MEPLLQVVDDSCDAQQRIDIMLACGKLCEGLATALART